MFGLLFKFMLCSLVTFVKRQKQLGLPGPGEISSYNTVFLSLLVCERVCVVIMVGGVSQSQQTVLAALTPSSSKPVGWWVGVGLVGGGERGVGGQKSGFVEL